MYVKNPFANRPAMSPAEKRALERRHLLYYLRVWDTAEDKMIGHIADVSTDGLMLVGEQKIDLDKTFNLKVMLPNPSDDGEPESIQFVAKSCWSSNDVNKLFYDTGFQFVDIPVETSEKLQDIIKEYALNS